MDLHPPILTSSTFPYSTLFRSALLRRQSLLYAQMYWADTASMRLLRRSPFRGSRRRRLLGKAARLIGRLHANPYRMRSGEHTSELQLPCNLVCRLISVSKDKTN